MNGIKDGCRCGCSREGHFEKKGACLTRGCDDCKKYRDASKPETLRPMPSGTSVVNARSYLGKGKPHADYACACDPCILWAHRRRV